jgi:hypothetical protein
MFIHVSLEIAILRERLGTDLALVRLYVVVDEFVALKMTKADKRCGALVAFEWLLTCE